MSLKEPKIIEITLKHAFNIITILSRVCDAMVKVVSHLPVTVEVRLYFHTILCGISDKQNVSGTGFFSMNFGFSPSVPHHQYSRFINSSITYHITQRLNYVMLNNALETHTYYTDQSVNAV